MKLRRIVLALVILTAASVRGDGTAVKSEVYADVAALKKVAESAWGGGQIDHLKHGSIEVVVMRQQFTSGVESCVVTVFTKDSRGWSSALSLKPVSMDWIEIRQDGNQVILSSQKSGNEILRFSISGLNSWSTQK